MTSTETTEKTGIIETKSGKIQGYMKDGLEIFKNIPFAEPPLGDLRFMPPVEKKPWDDVLDASEYGFCAFQGYTALEDWFGKQEPESEDCLNLNIWTPATDGKKRPVMFWVHGGAFIMGSGISPMYDGTHLAKRGDVVIVTINYRLGSLGFLYVPGITVNVGLLDQVTALKWVHDNIEAFGGDPDNITIFGESAGAFSVLALATLPATKGLIKRVIAQSAPVIEEKKSDKTTRSFMRSLGLKKGDLEGMRKISPEDLMKAQNKFMENMADLLAFRPLVDGDIMPILPLKAFKNGYCKDIDFMIGSNSEEFKLFLAAPEFKDLSGEKLENMLLGFLSMAGLSMNKGKELLQLYKKEGEGLDLVDILTTLTSDAMFRIHSSHYLETQNVHNPNTYNYLFTMKSPLLDGTLGACHALELPFVFGTTEAPGIGEFSGKGPDVDTVSQQMMDAWIAFARNGNPNAESIPDWPAYETEKRSTMVFGKETKIVEKYLDKQREAWDDTFKV